MIIVRTALLAATAFALRLASAQAETVNDTKWGFSAAFPCASEMTTIPMPTNAGPGTIVRYQCGSGAVYEVNINDFPKGSDPNADGEYKAGIEDLANTAHGTVRQSTSYILGNVMGRDGIVDIPGDQPVVAHIRIFVVGLRLYELLYVGLPGAENGSAALAFLNSFKLD